MTVPTPVGDANTPLAELYDRDPLNLSDQDLDRIIEDLRAKRVAHLDGVKSAGAAKTKAAKVPSNLKLGSDELLGLLGK